MLPAKDMKRGPAITKTKTIPSSYISFNIIVSSLHNKTADLTKLNGTENKRNEKLNEIGATFMPKNRSLPRG